ncbi:MAG: hypothetical protein JW841_04830 [Deltaproteobacteria bacterium]|nr:hypothetical protein [Deltaproteobacteria bacterium]
MQRWLIVVALLLGACSKSETKSNSATTTPQPKSIMVNITGQAAISEDIFKRYALAQQKILSLTKNYTNEMLNNIEQTRNLAKTNKEVAALAAKQQNERRLLYNEKVKKIREGAKVDKDTWNLLDKLYDSLFTSRMAWRQGGGDAAIKKLEEEVQAHLDKMPEDVRNEAKPEMMKLSDGLKNLRNGAETRKKYGDAAVNMALKYGAELENLRQELFQLTVRQRNIHK